MPIFPLSCTVDEWGKKLILAAQPNKPYPIYYDK